MQDDPYAILGVQKTASAEEIKKAYRKLARTSHPDINPDDPAAEARFVKISAAYDLLKDPETRRRFDAGEIDAETASAIAPHAISTISAIRPISSPRCFASAHAARRMAPVPAEADASPCPDRICATLWT